jgi:hypothetical protein
MRRWFIMAAFLFAATLCLAAPSYQIAYVAILAPDQASLKVIEAEIHTLKGITGFEWELPMGRFRIMMDASVLCKEDIIKAINAKSPAGTPLVGLYEPKDPRATLREIRNVATGMEAQYQKDPKAKELMPAIYALGVCVQRIAEALEKETFGLSKSDVESVRTKNHNLGVVVYQMELAARKDLSGTMAKGLEAMRTSVDDLTKTLDPTQFQAKPDEAKPAPKAP